MRQQYLCKGSGFYLAALLILAGCSDGSDDPLVNTVPGSPSLPEGLSGNYAAAAERIFASANPSLPWWCRGSGGTADLTPEECLDFSLRIDNAEFEARRYPTVADITAAGGVLVDDRPDGIGLAYTLDAITDVFAQYNPNVYLYGGDGNGGRLVGVAWSTDSGSEPDGFPGERETWVQQDGSGHWWLMAWILRGHLYQPDVFAAAHPCLTDEGTTLSSTLDPCYTEANPLPFDVMVTNDDGVMAPGIDALVEGLFGLPNMNIHIVAPLANQSGSGDAVTEPPFEIDGIPSTTASGRPATAVTSTDPADTAGSGSPADSVLYGLNTLLLAPELVLSGTNEGQNMANVGDQLSGTVGAARTARRQGAVAIATSTGALGAEPNFEDGVAATLALLERWRLGLEANTLDTVLNINIPSCVEGETLNGTINTIVAPDLAGRSYTQQDCSSTVPIEALNDDVDAFNNGFVSVADIGRDRPPNYPPESEAD